jgi:hypothetical protein
MLLRLGRATLWAALGYVSAAVLTYVLVMWLSSNTHDRQMEAGMTAAFVVGPAAGLLGFLMGLRRR